MTNHLSGSSSAYLRQHAENPINWWPWGNEALSEAVRRDVPILLSIGYAACHWCHVMAHESFEDEAVASYVNQHFVAIKVDREERPDIDSLYMAATQLVSGHGGWPMTVFLLPDARPFMAGTYYPPVTNGRQPSFRSLLEAMVSGWQDQREIVVRQAEELSRAMEREIRFVDHLAPISDAINFEETFQKLRNDLADSFNAPGGFGDAPKFPRGSYVQAMMRGNEHEQQLAKKTLDAMSRNGLYDHVAGGFARYSVDGDWHVPHFEKMLSDQALLIRTYAEAGRKWPESEYGAVARDVATFLLRDMKIPGGFASSLDADAAGEEGSHVTWTPQEVSLALSPEGTASVVIERLSIEEAGNFEGRSIPMLAAGATFAWPTPLNRSRQAMLEARSRRPQPGRDEKIVLEWNAMTACAFFSTNAPDLQEHAFELLETLGRTHFARNKWWRTETQQIEATALDVAWLCEATLDAYEATGADHWLSSARELATYLITNFWDGPVPSPHSPLVGNGFFGQSADVRDVPTRTKDVFDGATPSTHAVTSRALARLWLLSGDNESHLIAERNLEIAKSLVLHHPRSVVDLVEAAGYLQYGRQVVIPGNPGALVDSLRSKFMPWSVFVIGNGSNELLADRREGLAYLCENGTCQLPVESADALHELLVNR